MCLESRDKGERFIEAGDVTFELGVVGGFEPPGERGAGRITAFYKVIPGQEGLGGETDAVDGEVCDLSPDGGGDGRMTGIGEGEQIGEWRGRGEPFASADGEEIPPLFQNDEPRQESLEMVALVVGKAEGLSQTPDSISGEVFDVLWVGRSVGGGPVDGPRGQCQGKPCIAGEGGDAGGGSSRMGIVVEDGGIDGEALDEGDGGFASGVGEHLAEFIADAFAADAAKVARVVVDGDAGGFVEVESESCGESDGAESAKVILAEPLLWIADGTDEASMEVFLTINEIDDSALGSFGGVERIEEEGVDGEIASVGIFLGIGEDDAVGSSGVGVGVIASEGGNFDGVSVFSDQDDAKGLADGACASEEGFDAIGVGIGGDVVVFWVVAQEFIAHAAAGEVGGVSGVNEALDDGTGGVACVVHPEVSVRMSGVITGWGDDSDLACTSGAR